MAKIETIAYKRGSYIAVEGELSAHAFFIVQSGTVVLSRDVDIPGQAPIKLQAGDFFGVESALTGKHKIFTAIALTDCSIIVVPQSMYNELIQKKPSLVQKIIISFSNKMRELDAVLTKVSSNQKDNSGINIDHLVEVADYYYEEEQQQPAAFAYHHFIKNVKNHYKLEHAKERFEKLKANHEGQDLFLEEDVSQLLRKIPEGTMIFSEAMPGDTMYFIQDGSVKICKISNKSEITLAVLQKGDLFGEMALLENKPRSATAIAAKNSALLVISYQNFPAIIKRQPSLITRITTVLANRIWFVYRQISTVMLPAGQERLYDALMLFMERQGISVDTKEDIILNITVNDLFHHTGMNSKIGIGSFHQLVNAKAVRVTKDNYVQVLNPVFVQNRALHFREIRKARKKK